MTQNLVIKDYSKYTFLESFSKVAGTISFMKLPLHDLLKTPEGEKALELAKLRIIMALNKKEEKPNDFMTDKDVKLKTSSHIPFIISYGLARMIVSCTSQFIIDKFVNNEAEMVINLLNREDPRVKELVEKEINFNSQSKKIPLTEYVPLGMIKYGSDYKLVNCKIVKGFIIDEKIDMNLILKEKIKKIMMKKLPLTVKDDAQELLKSSIAEITGRSSELYKDDYGEVERDDFPPCMKYIISTIQKKENPTHYGRFALVSFCNKIGMENTEIVSLFQTVKDFELTTSLYQVEHITGKKGGTKYAAPSCTSLKTNNLCRSGTDPLCAKVKHPLGYYSAMKRKKKRQKSI